MAKTPNVGDQPVLFTPEFIQIPSIVAFDRDLQQLDKLLYGVVYWMERLKDGRCWVSNGTLAKITGSSSSGTANALVRLREKGYIVCIYDDGTNKRKEIRTLVYHTVNPYSNEEGGVTQLSKHR